jgi:hypothetical protein
MVKSHEDPYYESIYLSKEDSFYLSAFVLSKKKIYRLVKAFFRTDGVPLPAQHVKRGVQERGRCPFFLTSRVGYNKSSKK